MGTPQMAKRGQTVRRPPAGRKGPTKAKISSPKIKSESGNADLKRELAKARRELTEARQQQSATSEVLRVISSSPGELQPVFNAMLENATRTCVAAKFGILYQCEGDALRTVAIHGAPQSFVEERQRNPIVSPNPDTTLGRALSTKQPVQIADIRAEIKDFDARAAQLPKLAGARTVLAVPMVKENELLGAILIYGQEVRLFTDKQIELVTTFADQAVIAIENARLFNETKEALERQTATADILKVIASSPSDVQPVFDAIAERSKRLLEGLSTAVHSLVDDTLHLKAFTRINPEADAALQALPPYHCPRLHGANRSAMAKLLKSTILKSNGPRCRICEAWRSYVATAVCFLSRYYATGCRSE
jgi:two-component system, NtrC family, sensor kinase